MNLRKSLMIACFSFVFFSFFSSCDPQDESISGTWQLKDTEVWWVSPANPAAGRVKVPDIPFEEYVYTTPGTTNKTVVYYFGSESKLSRSHKVDGKVVGTIDYNWSQFPSYIQPDKTFDMTIESKGTLGNGIGVSSSAYTLAGWPSGSGVWTQSFRNGPKTVKLTIPKPADPTVASQMKFIVDCSSGVEYYIQFIYIYTWNP